MEATCLVWIFSVIVVPVQQSAGSLRGQLQRTHAEHSAHIHFASAGEQRDRLLRGAGRAIRRKFVVTVHGNLKRGTFLS